MAEQLQAINPQLLLSGTVFINPGPSRGLAVSADVTPVSSVCSRVDRFEFRQAPRQSWGSASVHPLRAPLPMCWWLAGSRSPAESPARHPKEPGGGRWHGFCAHPRTDFIAFFCGGGVLQASCGRNSPYSWTLPKGSSAEQKLLQKKRTHHDAEHQDLGSALICQAVMIVYRGTSFCSLNCYKRLQ